MNILGNNETESLKRVGDIKKNQTDILELENTIIKIIPLHGLSETMEMREE